MKKTGLLLLLWLCCCGTAYAQQQIIVNLAPIDGIDLTPDNLFNFQVHSMLPASTYVQITGQLHYRNANLRIGYSFNYMLHPGVNIISAAQVHPTWNYSSPALQDLFMQYKKLPAGTYEYCVNVVPTAKSSGDKLLGATFEQCLYHQSDEIFLINLISPEDKAKIYEYNPALTWVVNFPFANMLTYRVRVAQIMKGQNPQTAITRNNPVYDENGLMQNTIIYPIYAKPLQAFTPYAWTVDAYYRGILLGGAETWQFTIIEDSLLAGLPVNRSYIDITREKGTSLVYAEGKLKLKYVLEETRTDTLTLQILNSEKNEVKFQGSKLAAAYGDNRYDLNLQDSCNLKHMGAYTLFIYSKNGAKYTLPFKYINPDFIHQ